MKNAHEERRIDWDAIKHQLAEDRLALERNFAPSAELLAQMLKKRAAQLALQPKAEREPGEEFEILEFTVAGERYAFETRWVHEAYALKDFTQLPGTPPFVLGIANIRGRIISVIDLRKFFELPERGLSELNKVIILRDESMEFGVLADEVTGVDRLAASSLQESLPTLTGVRAEYLKGVTAGRLVLLDAMKLLKDESIVVNQEVSA